MNASEKLVFQWSKSIHLVLAPTGTLAGTVQCTKRQFVQTRIVAANHKPKMKNPNFTLAFSNEYLAAKGESTFGDIGLGLLDDYPQINFNFLDRRTTIIEPDQIADLDGLVIHDPYITKNTFITKPDRLIVVARMGAGYDKVDVSACTEAGVAVINAPDAMSYPTASAAVMYILALSKKLLIFDRMVRAGAWDRRSETRAFDLPGKTLGIIGLGKIGQELVRLIEPFGMKTLAYDPYIASDQAHRLKIKLASLDELLSQSDFVSVHCLLNDETRGLIGEAEFNLMKPSSYIINLARGPIIDHAALVSALTKKKIAGAGIDVFPLEPLPEDDPLINLDNVILTPHSAANTQDALTNSGLSVLRGIIQISQGQIPQNIVNREVVSTEMFQRKFEKYYRKPASRPS